MRIGPRGIGSGGSSRRRTGALSLLVLGSALLLTLAWGALAIGAAQRVTFYALDARSEYVRVRLADVNAPENRWLVDGMTVCQGRMADLMMAEAGPEPSDGLCGEGLERVTLPGRESILVPAPGSEVIAERSGGGPLLIQLRAPDAALSAATLETGAGVAEATELKDYVRLVAFDPWEEIASRAFSFAGRAEIGQQVGLGTDTMLLAGSISAFVSDIFAERHLADVTQLDAGDVVTFEPTAASTSRDTGSLRGFFRLAERRLDGLRVVYQGTAQTVRVLRPGSLGYTFRASWTARLLANPVALAIAAAIYLFASLVAILGALVPPRTPPVSESAPDVPRTSEAAREETGQAGSGPERPTEDERPAVKPAAATHLLAVPVAVLALLTADAARAEQAFVSATENGQALLLRSRGVCFALSPTHVVKPYGFASLVRQGRDRVHGDAVALHDFGYDLTVLEVDGEAAQACGPDLVGLATDDRDLPEPGSRAAVRVVHGNGSTEFVPVAIRGSSFTHLRLEPLDPDRPLRRGMSGGTVLRDDQRLGLLTAVDEGGDGVALRFDVALDTVDRFLTSGPAAEAMEMAPPPPERGLPLSAAAAGGVVTRATAASAGPGSTSERLIAPREEGGAWITAAAEFPVEVVVDLAGSGIVDVAAVVLYAEEALEGAALPRDVEIFRTTDRDGDRGWRSLGTFTFPQAVRERRLDLAPFRARRIKLTIHSNWGSPNGLALSRVEVHGPPP